MSLLVLEGSPPRSAWALLSSSLQKTGPGLESVGAETEWTIMSPGLFLPGIDQHLLKFGLTPASSSVGRSQMFSR